MQKSRCLVFLLVGCCLLMLLSSCYRRPLTRPHGSVQFTEEQLDSITFARTHHYTMNFNFVVSADSVMLTRQLPEEALSDLPTDSFAVRRNAQLVVADVHVLPNDTVDSVWVQLADVNGMFGWVHESELLQGVSPDDPISQFIDTFSNAHLLVFMAFIMVAGGAFALRRLLCRRAYIVHLNDIDSFYPMLLCLLIAASATLYASIQMFGAESWRHYYFHPSLNPFALPFHLALFIASVWIIIIVSLAVLQDVRRQLSTTDALLYLIGLAAVCGVVYVVFSVGTLYYIGYPLLVVYIAFAITCYRRQPHARYHCGQCGQKLRSKGRCPYCGAQNV